jgi:hypothetical protein
MTMTGMTARVLLSHAWIDDSPARVAENPRRGLVRLLRDALLADELDAFYDADDLTRVIFTVAPTVPASGQGGSE